MLHFGIALQHFHRLFDIRDLENPGGPPDRKSVV
jgi:hypothetical protein